MGGDPRVHVRETLARSSPAVRNMIAGTFGLVGDLPSVVASGCGLRVPYAMTSERPESVTCPACREYARARHLRFADDVERLGSMPGSTVGAADAAKAAQAHRDLAKRFAVPDN